MLGKKLFNHFVSYQNLVHETTPLLIKFPKLKRYLKVIETKSIWRLCVLADKHKDILDKYNEIWSKDNALLTKILTTLNLCTMINI